MLSLRLLIFTKEQAFFVCAHGWKFKRGIPMGYFDAALLFIGTHHCSRREAFRSWSCPNITSDWDSTVKEVVWMRWRPDGGRYETIKSTSVLKVLTDNLEKDAGADPNHEASKDLWHYSVGHGKFPPTDTDSQRTLAGFASQRSRRARRRLRRLPRGFLYRT